MFTLVAEGIGLPAGLITAIVLARSLGPEMYGGYTVVATTVAITEWLLIAVLARAVVKFVAEAPDWRPVATTALRLFVGAGLALAATFWLTAPAIASILRDDNLAALFRMFAPQIAIFSAGAACRNVLAGQGRYREQAFASAASWLGRVGFIVLFVSLGWGLRGAIAGSLVGTLTGSLAALAMARVPLRSGAPFPARRLLQLALPAFVAMLAARLLDQVGLLTLQALNTDPAEVGYYGAAMNVFMLTGVIAAAVAPVLLSSVSAARHGGDLALVTRISSGAVRFGIVLLPFAFVVTGSAAEIVGLLFGDSFAPAAQLMALLVVSAVARAAIAVIAALLMALGYAWTAAIIAIPLPVVALGAQLFFIPNYGAGAAAAVTCLVALAGAAISTAVACRATALGVPWSTLLRSGLLSAAAWGIAALWPAAGAMVMVKAAMLGALVLAAFLASGELDGEEREELRRSLLRR